MGYIEAKSVERIELVSDSKYWVELSTEMNWSDMKKIANVTDDGKVSYQVDALLSAALVAWNIDDENGDVLPITQENIDCLRRPDIEKIIATLGGKIEEPVETKKAS